MKVEAMPLVLISCASYWPSKELLVRTLTETLREEFIQTFADA